PLERGLLLVDATASKTIAPDLRESLNVWRGGVRDKAKGALLRVIERLEAAGALAIAERLYVQQVDVEGDATEAVLRAVTMLESTLDDRDQAGAAWNVLIADGLRLCREGGSRTASGLTEVLGLANIVLSDAP